MKYTIFGVTSFRVAAAAVLALVLSACGGGDTVPYTGVQVRPLSADFTSRRAVAYSPYRTATGPEGLQAEVITKANIKQDLDLLLAAGFRLIRLFDSSDKVARQTLEVIRDNNLNIKMQLGSFVLSGNDVASRQEIARTIALANEFRDIVLAVSVGNETMVSWAFNRITPALMADYIRTVRSQITQPVTTDDNYAFWASAPTVITDQIDFVALHTYANLDTWFDPTRWNWKLLNVPESQRAVAMMDAAIAETKRQYQEARDFLDKKGLSYIPIIVGETGWNAVDVGRQAFRAHPVNQKMYLDRLDAWVAEGRAGAGGPKQVFYFEAFDEPWKGSDDKWGLFNVQRQARYVIQNLYPQSMWAPVIPANDADSNGVYTEADALYWVPMSNDPVSASRYTLYAENFTLNEARPATPTLWNAWENGTSASAVGISGTTPPDGTTSLQITPQPLVWGWGIAMNLKEANLSTDASADLSAFANGTLNFSVRSTYPGLLEVGFYTGRGSDQTGADAYVLLASGQHGYVNDGNWHRVSIPVSAILAAAPNADLRQVSSPFVIADRYDRTGKAQRSGITTRIDVDDIHWAR